MEELGLLLGAASAIPQWLTGYNQGEKADSLSNGLVRPDFTIPQAEQDALASAKSQASMTQLPGQAAIEGRLDQTTANTVDMIKKLSAGGPEAINGAGVAYGNLLGKENELGVAGAQMRLNNNQILRNEDHTMAGYQEKKWDWEKAQPYQQTTQAIQALREGQIRNENSAWKNILGVGANFFGGMGDSNNNSDWTKMLGNGSTTATSDPNSPLFKTDFGSKPLFDSFDLNGIR